MDALLELIGRLAVVVVFACPAAYHLVHGLRAGPRSRRLADFALFFGLSAFVMPEMALGIYLPDHPWLLLTSGAVRVLLGSAAIGCAVVAMAARRDGGTSLARPASGVGFGLLHAGVGVGLLLSGASAAAASAPWTYESPDGSYCITLPSSEWVQIPSDGKPIVSFLRQSHKMQTTVLPIKKDQSEADYRRTIESFHAQIEANPQIRDQLDVREGGNDAGNRYHYCDWTDVGPDGDPVFVAYSASWCEKRRVVVEVVLEGVPSRLSQAGKASEMERFAREAEAICLSVE